MRASVSVLGALAALAACGAEARAIEPRIAAATSTVSFRQVTRTTTAVPTTTVVGADRTATVRSTVTDMQTVVSGSVASTTLTATVTQSTTTEKDVTKTSTVPTQTAYVTITPAVTTTTFTAPTPTGTTTVWKVVNPNQPGRRSAADDFCASWKTTCTSECNARGSVDNNNSCAARAVANSYVVSCVCLDSTNENALVARAVRSSVGTTTATVLGARTVTSTSHATSTSTITVTTSKTTTIPQGAAVTTSTSLLSFTHTVTIATDTVTPVVTKTVTLPQSTTTTTTTPAAPTATQSITPFGYLKLYYGDNNYTSINYNSDGSVALNGGQTPFGVNLRSSGLINFVQPDLGVGLSAEQISSGSIGAGTANGAVLQFGGYSANPAPATGAGKNGRPIETWVFTLRQVDYFGQSVTAVLPTWVNADGTTTTFEPSTGWAQTSNLPGGVIGSVPAAYQPVLAMTGDPSWVATAAGGKATDVTTGMLLVFEGTDNIY